MIIKSLREGVFIVDKEKNFHPCTTLQCGQTPNTLTNIKGIKVAINPFVVKIGQEVLVIDTGLGLRNKHGELLLHANLRSNGLPAGSITHVLLTHLHFDHVAGAFYTDENTGRLRATFPNARYYFQAKEIEAMLASNLQEKHFRLLEALKESPNARPLNGNGNIGSSIQYEITGGHTEFHQIFKIHYNGQRIFFGGDVLPQHEQLNMRFIAKYDFDGQKSYQMRNHYAREIAEEEYICLFYHGIETLAARITASNQHFVINKLTV